MARRNIFDRDTGAGYYSDALGNFLENIPSFYGQMAREKRLERQRIEDVNYRNQTYNNQLLQQSRTNRRLAKSDKLTREKFEEDKKRAERTERHNALKFEYEATGDPTKLIQFNKRYNLCSISKDAEHEIINTWTSSKDFDTDYTNYTSLSFEERLQSGDKLKELMNQASSLANRGSSANRVMYRGIYGDLNDEMRDLVSKSGKLIPVKDWTDGIKKGMYENEYAKFEDMNDIIKGYKEEQGKIQIVGYKDVKQKDGSTIQEPQFMNNDEKEAYYNLQKSIQRANNEGAMHLGRANQIADKVRYPKFQYESLEKEKKLAEIEKMNKEEQERVNKLAGIEKKFLTEDQATDDFIAHIFDVDTNIDDWIQQQYNSLGDEEPDLNYAADQEVETVPEQITEDVEDETILTDNEMQNLGFEETDENIERNIEEDIAEDIGGGGEPTTLPPGIPSLSASQQEIEDREKPESALDDLFSKDVEKEAVYDPSTLRTVSVTDKYQDPGQVDTSEAAKYDIEPFTHAVRYGAKKDDKVVAQEKRKISNYITYKLDKDLKRLIDNKKKQSQIESKGYLKIETAKRDYEKRQKSILDLENKIKELIGNFINPVSGDIAIASEGYKKSVMKDLNKKIGKDLYPLLASLSSVQRIN